MSGGKTCSTRCAARSAIRRPPQLGRTPLPLHENGSNRSNAQSPQRIRAKPCASTPQVRKSLNSCSTNSGRGGAVRVTLGGLEEGVKVLVDHAVQHGVLGIAWPVARGAEGHRGDIDSERERRQCPKMDTPQPLGTAGGGSLEPWRSCSRQAGRARFATESSSRQRGQRASYARSTIALPPGRSSKMYRWYGCASTIVRC